MAHYKDLTDSEKILFDRIENIFINHVSIEQKSFTKVLEMVKNKYNKKRLRVEL